MRDPAYSEPWVLVINLALSAPDLLAFYHDRWPIEQVLRSFSFCDWIKFSLKHTHLPRITS